MFELIESFLFFGNGMGIGIALGLIALPAWAIFSSSSSERTKAIVSMIIFIPGVLIIGFICFLILNPQAFY